MLSDVKIYHAIPIINDYLRIPPCQEPDKTRITVAQAENKLGETGASPPMWSSYNIGEWGTHQLSLGSGANTGSKFGAQRFFVLPPVTAGVGYTTDPITILNAGS